MKTSLMTAACGLVLLGSSSIVSAADVLFASDPFAGSTALITPGRQVFGGGERTLAGFDFSADTFVLDRTFFQVGETVAFANAAASALSPSGLNIVVLRDTDNDANPATAFNAGTAANLIAAAIDTPGAGFFIYSNSSLGVNRLVYSTNLSDNTADLAILARIASPTGAAAVAALAEFEASNFSIVPAPAGAMLGGVMMLAVARRRR